LGVPAPWSFDRALLEGVSATRVDAAPDVLRGPVAGVRLPTEVDLNVLARWVSRPVERYAHEILGIHALYAHKDVAAREPLELDIRSTATHLLALLRSPAFRAGMRGREDDAARSAAYEQVRASVRARGVLPLGGPGDLAFAGQWNRASAIADHVAQHDASGVARRVPVHVDVDGTQVFGVEQDLRGSVLLHVTPYALHSHLILSVWVRLVALAADARTHVTGACLVGWRTTEPVGVAELRLRAPDPETARAILRDLVGVLREAHVSALPFTADAARAFCEGKDPASMWEPDQDRYPPSDDVRLVRQVLGEESPFNGPDGTPHETFRALVARTWAPLTAHLEETPE
jgi:exonuclease V gamma subunit